jgi:hypothetical protein
MITENIAVLCPVCRGRGRVPPGFYSAIGVDFWTTSTLDPEPCRSCSGEGYVVVPAVSPHLAQETT